jgi:anaerobic selenocysteine-containing dehydrogenase
MMPYEVINLSSGWLPNPHFLTKTLFDHQLREDESFAEINPQTAKAHKVKEGDRVVITSARGAIRVRVHLFDGARPGVVYLPMGFGHTAYDEYQKGKGVNPHEIMNGKTDPLSGQPAWWATRVKIEKV